MKPCKADNCYSRRWGGGYCKFHQFLRTDKDNKKRAVTNFGYKDQTELFNKLWDDAKIEGNSIVVCKYTGKTLNHFENTDLWWSCFAHVLPKGRYTYFKLNPANIRIVYPDFHTIVDQGTSDDRAEHLDWDFDKWDREKEEMKIEYQNFRNQNLLS